MYIAVSKSHRWRERKGVAGREKKDRKTAREGGFGGPHGLVFLIDAAGKGCCEIPMSRMNWSVFSASASRYLFVQVSEKEIENHRAGVSLFRAITALGCGGGGHGGNSAS